MLFANETRTVANVKGTWIHYRVLELESKWIVMNIYILCINTICFYFVSLCILPMVTTNRKLKNCGGLQAPTQHQKHSILQHNREPGITVNSAKMCIQAPTQAQKKHSLLL
jgi:hypothetical protein